MSATRHGVFRLTGAGHFTVGRAHLASAHLDGAVPQAHVVEAAVAGKGVAGVIAEG